MTIYIFFFCAFILISLLSGLIKEWFGMLGGATAAICTAQIIGWL